MDSPPAVDPAAVQPQTPGEAMALRIVTETARMLGAEALVPIRSAHVDGCLYHGDSGTLFAERLLTLGARVCVPTTLNVGALDLVHAGRVRLDPHRREMAARMMRAYAALGCTESWTCAPYQAGHRPLRGEDVAWGESNAVAFCNSVLGARTNRYGDFLDICAAVTGFAPRCGLHLEHNRRATLCVDAGRLPPRWFDEDAFYPVLGAWLGREAGADIAAVVGLPAVSEDRLKALGAAAASTGAVGLFHIVGTTPEAPDAATAFAGRAPARTVTLDAATLAAARERLSTARVAPGEPIQAVAVGSPHLSVAELRALATGLDGRRCAIPLYACTGRHALAALDAAERQALEQAGVVLVADTCIVVTPILPEGGGVLLTNSGKFAHYTTANTGYGVLYGSTGECVESAVAGRFVRMSGALP